MAAKKRTQIQPLHQPDTSIKPATEPGLAAADGRLADGWPRCALPSRTRRDLSLINQNSNASGMQPSHTEADKRGFLRSACMHACTV